MSTLPTIKPDLDDWDWAEYVTFDTAIEMEGYEYAFDNYSPLFRRPDLRALEGDMGKLRDFMRAHEDALESWREGLEEEVLDSFYDAHIHKHREEADRRRDEPTEPAAPEAYVHGDGHYLWLTCGGCEEPIKQIDTGDDLAGMNAAAAAHQCTPKTPGDEA